MRNDRWDQKEWGAIGLFGKKTQGWRRGPENDWLKWSNAAIKGNNNNNNYWEYS
jgi:hypothetical protein